MIKFKKQTVNNAKWESPQIGCIFSKYANLFVIELVTPKHRHSLIFYKIKGQHK